ncbi:MAG: tetratricopeptide repeat protein [Acidobacteria bacterium]|nr:tetratricopeptide repeat protein [Acidobacteriota bacterium]
MAKRKITKTSAPEAAEKDSERERAGGPVLTANYYVWAGLTVVCVVIYAQTVGFDFINLDDDVYIYENPFVSGGFSLTNLKWALTAFHVANWHPLTWISHQIDASLFGVEPAGHHAVNVIFHIVNSILLFVVVNKLTKAFWKSAVVAAIFAVHPAHVESVAWIAERKDVLSTLFWLLTTWFYLKYARSALDEKRSGLLWAAVLCFALGLASKPMLVTLPFTLILLDYWALERFDKWTPDSLLPLVKEKIPFFALSLVSSIITVFAQKAGGAIQSIETFPLGDRVLNGVVSYAKYVAMFFYPANLGVWYPFESDFGAAQIAASIVLLVGVTVLCLWQLRERKYLFVGWFWFLGTLVPVIGILQVGRQALADRYTYVSYVGLSILVVWMAAEIFERLRLNRTVVAVICGICLLAATALSFRQAAFWKTSETLYTRTLSVTGNNYLVKNNFCNYLEKKNRFDEAAAQCSSAIGEKPELPDAYNTLGTVQIKQNKLAEAKLNFQKAVELNPKFVLAYANLAVVETNQNNFDAAAANLKTAVEIDNGQFFDANRLLDAYTSLAVAAIKQKSYTHSAEFFRKAAELAPNNADLQRNLALSLHMTGRSAEGIGILEELIRKNPNVPEAYNTLGLIYAEQNRKQEAAAQFQKALQINPNFTPAQNNLRRVLGQN